MRPHLTPTSPSPTGTEVEQPPDPRRLPFGPGTMLKLQVRGLVQRAKSVMGFEDSDEDSGDEFDNDDTGEWKPMGNYGKARNLKSINLGDGRKTKSGRRKTRGCSQRLHARRRARAVRTQPRGAVDAASSGPAGVALCERH